VSLSALLTLTAVGARRVLLNNTLSRFIAKAIEEGKKLFWIVLYLWVLIGLFSIFKSLVLKERYLFYHQGFAIINALVLAKVVLVAELLQIAENMRRKPLVYPVLLKSAVFCAILIGFYIGEEMLVGVLHGKSLAESFPDIGGGSGKGILAIGLIFVFWTDPIFRLPRTCEGSRPRRT
jgi:hypothetical protein